MIEHAGIEHDYHQWEVLTDFHMAASKLFDLCPKGLYLTDQLTSAEALDLLSMASVSDLLVPVGGSLGRDIHTEHGKGKLGLTRAAQATAHPTDVVLRGGVIPVGDGPFDGWYASIDVDFIYDYDDYYGMWGMQTLSVGIGSNQECEATRISEWYFGDRFMDNSQVSRDINVGEVQRYAHAVRLLAGLTI